MCGNKITSKQHGFFLMEKMCLCFRADSTVTEWDIIYCIRCRIKLYTFRNDDKQIHSLLPTLEMYFI